jgi:hypothetical protein
MPGYTLSEGSGGLRITLPKGTNWAELCFGTLGTALFTYLLFPAAVHSFHRRPWHSYDHMLMYTGFGFALSLALSPLLWTWALLGRQLLTLDGITFTHRREILGIGFSREYDWSAVRDLRVRVSIPAQPVPGAPAVARVVFHLRGSAVLAFDYGARTFELGRGLDESSAHELVALITQRFPCPTGPNGTN